jgi:hypothetical protein
VHGDATDTGTGFEGVLSRLDICSIWKNLSVKFEDI